MEYKQILFFLTLLYSTVIANAETPSGPRDVSVTLMFDPPVARVTWQAPEQPHGNINSYRVTWGSLGQTGVTERNLPGNSHRLTTGLLDKGITYEFRISAANNAGFGEETIKTVTTPDGVPTGAPIDVTATVQRANNVLLQWTPPQPHLTNGRIARYEIMYEQDGSDDRHVIETTSTEVLVSELTVNQGYVFRLKACTSAGCGPWSVYVTAQTIAIEPSVPEEVRLSLISKEPPVVTVTWDPPRYTYGDINMYKLTYGIQGDTMVTARFPSDHLHHTTGFLEMGEVYEFRVSASNDVGYGEEGVQTITIPGGQPRGPPRDVDGVRLNDTVVILEWEPPAEPLGEIIYYTVLYYYKISINDVKNQGVQVVNTTASQLLVDDLQPNTVYYFQVSAHNEKGRGPWSSKLSIHTTPTPPVPENVHAYRLADTKAMLTWDPLPDITSYRVYYNQYALPDMSTWDQHLPASPHTVLTGLEPLTAYAVKVQASGLTDNWGDISDIVVIEASTMPPERCYGEVEDVGLLEMAGGITDVGDLAECQQYCDLSPTSCLSVLYTLTGSCILLSNNSLTEVDMLVPTSGSTYSYIQPCPARCYSPVEDYGFLVQWDYTLYSISSLTECEARCDAVHVMTSSACLAVQYHTTGYQTGMCTLSSSSHVTLDEPDSLKPIRGIIYASVTPCPVQLPGRPHNLTISMLSEEPAIAELSWEEPEDGGGEVTMYRLRYGIRGQSLNVERGFPGYVTDCLAGFLEKGTPYEFHVAAGNEAGYGEESVGTITTSGADGPGAPQSLGLSSDVVQTVRISWHGVPQVGVMYEVMYGRADDVSRDAWTSVNTSQTHLFIDGLQQGTRISFAVRVHSSEGVSPWSSATVTVTANGEPEDSDGGTNSEYDDVNMDTEVATDGGNYHWEFVLGKDDTHRTV